MLLKQPKREMILWSATFFVIASCSYGDKIYLERTDFFANDMPDHGIFVLDTMDFSLKTLVESKEMIDRLSVSPSGRNLAVIRNHESKETRIIQSSLDLLSTRGELLKTIDMPIHQYVWHPQKDIIAYVKVNNNNYSDHRVKFLGIWLYDVATGVKGKLCDEGYEVQWAKFDNSLYVLADYRQEGEFPRVKKWDDALNKLVETPYKDFNFSPDGKFYFYSAYMGPKDLLYDRETNKEITNDYTCLREALSYQFDKWMSNSVLKILSYSGKAGTGSGILDCTNGTLRDVRDRIITLMNDDSAFLVSRKDCRFETTNLVDLKILCTGINATKSVLRNEPLKMETFKDGEKDL